MGVLKMGEQGTPAVLVDCAGGRGGGAARFIEELRRWRRKNPQEAVRLLGLRAPVTARHLARRELQTLRGRFHRVIALNNVGYVTGSSERWLLLRNALHFPFPGERPELPARIARRVRAQSSVIRVTAKRADVVVVPTSAMAERVSHHLPELANRISVVPHPVSPRDRNSITEGLIVCPMLPAPYKRMRHHLTVLTQAAEQLYSSSKRRLDLRITATQQELAALGLPASCSLTPVGHLSARQLDPLLAMAQVIYYPAELESFGYPLAEARANGQPVVAPGSVQTKEVAGNALVPYQEATPDAIASALECALSEPPPAPDPAPFDPDAYFRRWLS